MKKRTLSILLLVILLISIAKAEVIDGPANFRLAPNGQILVSLNGGTDVECTPLEQGWFNVSFDIPLTREQYENGYLIKNGDKLFDFKHKLIGIALADIPKFSSPSSTTGGAPGNPARYWMEVIGYVAKSNIKDSSIPENALNMIINKNRAALKFDNLKNFITSNRYEGFDLLKKFYPRLKEYYISESAVGGGSALDRIRLIFDDDDLIAIVHSRALSVENVKEYNLVYGNRIIIFKTPKGVTISTFIKKNKEAYNGAN